MNNEKRCNGTESDGTQCSRTNAATYLARGGLFIRLCPAHAKENSDDIVRRAKDA